MYEQANQNVRFIPGPLPGLEGLEAQFSNLNINYSTNYQVDPRSGFPGRDNKSSNDNRNQQMMYNALSNYRRTFYDQGRSTRSHQFGSLTGMAADTGNQSNVYWIRNQSNEAFHPGVMVQRKACNFCISNGESDQFAHSHNLRETGPRGRLVLTCPVLRSYVCEFCGASGDSAHTRTHCPIIIANNGGVKPESVAKRLTQSSHLSCGRRRILKNRN